MTDDKTRQLENRIETLESTIEKMMPSRRDALKMGGAALVGGAAMSGTASAGTNQVGTIGSQASPVDLESEDINNSDTVTTENLVVNNTATGPFGGGGILVEPGDSLTVANVDSNNTSGQFVTLYNDVARDLLGGVISGRNTVSWLYTFDDNSTVRKNGSGTSFPGNNINMNRRTDDGATFEIDFMPPAKNVKKIEVGAFLSNGGLAAEAILKD